VACRDSYRRRQFLIVVKSVVPRAMALRTADLFYKLILMPPSLGTLELAALLAVVRLGDGAYGLAVRHDLSERAGRDYSVGAIYTTLQRLEDKGLLTSRASEPLPVRGGRSRRHFRLTGAGARALRDAERHAASMWDGVGTRFRPRPA
jgi:PadR family transcriptional regulator PadR